MIEQSNLISIVMPVKDTALYLDDCIQSIIDQEFENWELLAVNDQSSDASLSVLEKYALQVVLILAVDLFLLIEARTVTMYSYKYRLFSF